MAQGDARGGHYANDPHSHADVYTALELGAAVLAALVPARAHRPRRPHRRVDGADDALRQRARPRPPVGRTPCPTGVIRSFRPMDYPVLTAANGESVIVSGHPAENKTFDFYMMSIGRDRPHRRPTVRRHRRPPGAPRRRSSRRWTNGRRTMPDARVDRGRDGGQPAGGRQAALGRRGLRHRLGRGARGRRRRVPTAATARSASPTRRGASTAPTSAPPASRGIAARTTAPCSPTLLGHRRRRARPAGGRRRADQPHPAPKG